MIERSTNIRRALRQRQRGFIINPFRFGSAAPPTTWSTTDKATSLTLSVGNLRVTRNSGAGLWGMVRATVSKSSGKHYFEVQHTVNGPSGGGDFGAGLAIGTDPLNSYPGGPTLSAQGAGFFPTWPTNARRYRSGTGVDLTGYGRIGSTGLWCAIAADMDAGQMWFRINGSAWVGGGDPAAGTSPTYTFTAGTVMFPALAIFDDPQSCLANFGATAFNGAVPSGFSGWN